MKGNRRALIKGLGATALGIGFSHGVDPPQGGGLQEELLNLLEADGYDPSGSNSALLAVVSDPHIVGGTEYPHLRTDTYDDGLIAEINSFDTLVTELVMAGDSITYHSMSPGIPAYNTHRVWAIEEFQRAKVQIGRFNYRTWIVPGNHDTNAYETNAELFREQMGQPVAYQMAVLGGVPVFFLNSGNAGMLDQGQAAWLRAEVDLIAKDQEVLIVVHIPPMASVFTQAGHKRILTDVFKDHESTVWVVSGHNHLFSELKFSLGGVTYIQTQVTTASQITPQPFGDNRNPGYGLLALQDGKVVSRIFRSLRDTGFQARSPISQMSPNDVRFPFDDVQNPMGVYEEGFYDHVNRVVGFSGVHVGSYIAYCKNMTIQVDPADYLGRVSKFIVSASISASNVPACRISPTGVDGSWTLLDFPAAKGNGLYTVLIPEAFRDNLFFIKLETGLTLSIHGYSMSGWALVADPDHLTGYDKWIVHQYGTLEKSDENHPHHTTLGTGDSNIANFGFNLMPIDNSVISGPPELKVVENSVCMKFPRMTAEANPGINYVIECSDDLGEWNAVESDDIEENILQVDGAWEEVESKIQSPFERKKFYRVTLFHSQDWPE